MLRWQGQSACPFEVHLQHWTRQGNFFEKTRKFDSVFRNSQRGVTAQSSLKQSRIGMFKSMAKFDVCRLSDLKCLKMSYSEEQICRWDKKGKVQKIAGETYYTVFCYKC